MIDLSKLPAPNVIEALSYEQIYAERKHDLIAKWPLEEQREIAELLEIESEPLTKLLQENAYRELILRQRINDAARSVFAAYAKGSDLDNLLILLGVERQEGESDKELLARALLAPQAFSTAGPTNAYKYHALSAHPEVLDVAVDRPVAGTVRISVLGREQSGTPSNQALTAVESALNEDDVRPLSDTVLVEPAEIQAYRIHARLRISTGAASEPIQQVAQQAANDYAQAQHRLGGEIRFSGLYAALHQAGVRTVELLEPKAELESSPRIAPYCLSVKVEVAHDDS